MSQKKGILFTVISAVAFGVTPLLCTNAYEMGATPETVIVLRTMFVMPILWMILKIQKVDLRIQKKTAIYIFMVSVFGMSATSLFLYNAYRYIPVGIATTLHFLYPVFVAVMNFIFYKKQISKVRGMILMTATCGIFFFLETAGNISVENLFSGILLSITSAATYAFYMTGIEQFKLNQMNSYKLTFYLSLFSFMFMLPFSVLTHRFTALTMQPAGFLYAFLVALVSSFLAVYTLQLGIKYLGASSAAIFCTLEPVTAVITGCLFLNEEMTFMKVVGSVVILGAVTMLALLDKQQES